MRYLPSIPPYLSKSAQTFVLFGLFLLTPLGMGGLGGPSDLDPVIKSDCIDCIMTSITIRRLPTATKEKLRLRAARSGLSLESYSRQILQAAAEVDSEGAENVAELALTCFGTDNGIDLQLPPRGEDRAPLAFD